MRIKSVMILLLCSGAAIADAAPTHDGSHDFDFELGTWATHVKRLVKPLTGSTTWVEMNGVNGEAGLDLGDQLDRDGTKMQDGQR